MSYLDTIASTLSPTTFRPSTRHRSMPRPRHRHSPIDTDRINETASHHHSQTWAVPVPIGYRIGDWEVTAGIATGNWASVYAARRHLHDEPTDAALKFAATGTLTRRQTGLLRDMIERELAVHHGAHHHRLIRCHEIHEVDDAARPELDGLVVLVLDRAERSLADLIADQRGTPTPGAAALIEQICEGLDHLHRKRWVHADLKPANVLVMADGSVRLADFGLATEIEGTHGYMPPLGSSDYIPPERWTERLGGRGLPVRPTADIWALGIIAYELITGHHPFPGAGVRTRAIAAAQYTAGAEPIQFPADLPTSWRSFLTDCLAPTHAERARHDAASLLARVRAMPSPRSALSPPQTRPPIARPPVTRSHPARGRHRSRASVATTGVAVAVTMAVGAAALWHFTPLGEGATPGDGRRAPVDIEVPAEYRPDILRTEAIISPQYRQPNTNAATTSTAPGLPPALAASMLTRNGGATGAQHDDATEDARHLDLHRPEPAGSVRTGAPS